MHSPPLTRAVRDLFGCGNVANFKANFDDDDVEPQKGPRQLSKEIHNRISVTTPYDDDFNLRLSGYNLRDF